MMCGEIFSRGVHVRYRWSFAKVMRSSLSFSSYKIVEKFSDWFNGGLGVKRKAMTIKERIIKITIIFPIYLNFFTILLSYTNDDIKLKN